MTQAEVAKRIGVTPSAYAMYERGEREPNIDTLNKIADIFNADVNVFYGRKTSPIKIPVLGYVAAGIPISAITDILDYEELSPDMVKDGSEYFALKIKGQSMEPRIYDGDVVIVRAQPDVDSGQIAIVCVNGDEATCKKIMKQPGGILLQPLNPTYETVFYSAEQIERIPITILGRVVELRGKF
jgi:repressor LexA